MSDLIVIAYPDQFRAAEVLATLSRLQLSYLIDLDDACYVTKDAAGKIKLHHSTNLTAEGALVGGFWGALIGLFFFSPLVGGAIGAAEGALLAATGDYGITNEFIESVALELKPGTSALFILARQVTADKVSAELAKFGGTILETSLPQEVEDKWRAAFAPPTSPTNPA